MFKVGGFAPFRVATRKKVLILTYHRFSLGHETAKVSAADLESHLEYLSRHNNVIPLAEVVARLKTSRPLPANAAVITIDDGYRDAYEIAFPKLKKFGFPATLYAITDFLAQKAWLWTDKMRYVLANTREMEVTIEFGADDRLAAKLTNDAERRQLANRINERLKKLPNNEKDAKIGEIASQLGIVIPGVPSDEFAAMTWEQAREMDADNVRIEAHTVTHPILTNIGQSELDFEMRASKKRLEEVLGRRVDHFCYPNGSFNDNVRQAATTAGYESAVTTQYGFNDGKTDRFLLNRIDAQSAIESFAQSTSGFEALKQRMFAARA